LAATRLGAKNKGQSNELETACNEWGVNFPHISPNIIKGQKAICDIKKGWAQFVSKPVKLQHLPVVAVLSLPLRAGAYNRSS